MPIRRARRRYARPRSSAATQRFDREEFFGSSKALGNASRSPGYAPWDERPLAPCDRSLLQPFRLQLTRSGGQDRYSIHRERREREVPRIPTRLSHTPTLRTPAVPRSSCRRRGSGATCWGTPGRAGAPIQSESWHFVRGRGSRTGRRARWRAASQGRRTHGTHTVHTWTHPRAYGLRDRVGALSLSAPRSRASPSVSSVPHIYDPHCGASVRDTHDLDVSHTHGHGGSVTHVRAAIGGLGRDTSQQSRESVKR